MRESFPLPVECRQLWLFRIVPLLRPVSTSSHHAFQHLFCWQKRKSDVTDHSFLNLEVSTVGSVSK
jgi:hypothetical protein